MGPFDYSMNVQSPADALFTGLAFGDQRRAAAQQLAMGEQQMGLAASQEARAAAAFAAAQEDRARALAQEAEDNAAAEAMNADFLALSERVAAGQYNADDFNAMALKYPDFADEVAKTWEGRAKARRDEDTAALMKGITALKLGRPDITITMLENRAVAAENAGDQMEADISRAMIASIKADPNSALAVLGTTLSALDPEAAATVFGKAPEMTADQKNYAFYVEQETAAGRTPLSFNEWDLQGKKAGASTTTVNTGSEVGTIPQGFELITDPATGARSMRPIAGGPEDRTRADANKRASEAQNASIVRTAIADVKNLLADSGIWDAMPETGIVGARLAELRLNQEAVDVAQILATIQASVAFDTLAAMRAASPTGGALGAVSDTEMKLLQSTMGSLSNELSPEQLLKSLNTIDEIMRKFEAYPSAAIAGSANSSSQPGAGSTAAPPASPASRRPLADLLREAEGLAP